MHLKRNYFICWVDNLNKNVDPFVKGFCRNLTEYWFMELDWQVKLGIESKEYEKEWSKLFYSHYDALDFLKTTSVDHALIINIGNDLEGNYPQFIRAFDEYILDDDILIGHILDKNDRYYELHEQLYYLNVKKWKAISCPNLGKIGVDITYNIPNRSKENHHDNYTPYWISGSNNSKLYTNVKHGHNLIAKILETDTKIRSFPEHIRKTKEYFYPNENDCNDAIYKFIHKNLSTKFYPINTEQLHTNLLVKNLSAMVTVSSGLNHLKVIKYTGYKENFKLMFCDYDEYALYMMRQIYENWDGTNYKDFMNDVDTLNILGEGEFINHGIFTEFVDSFGGKEQWLSWFKDFKNNVKVDYLKLDILNFKHQQNEFNILLELLNDIEGNKLVWLSNIFCYRPTSLFKNLYKRSLVQDNLMAKFKNISELQVSYGPTINGWNGGWIMSPKEYKPCVMYAKELIEWPE